MKTPSYTDWLDFHPDYEFTAFAPGNESHQRETAKTYLRDFFDGIGNLIASMLPGREIGLWARILEKDHAEKMIGACSDIIQGEWEKADHKGKPEMSDEFLAEVKKSIQSSVEKAHGAKFTPEVERAFRFFRPAWERVVEAKKAEASVLADLAENGRIERKGFVYAITALPESGKYGVRVTDTATRENKVLDFAGTMADARKEACAHALGSRTLDIRKERFDFVQKLKSDGVVTRNDTTFQVVDDPGGKFGIRVTQDGKTIFSSVVGSMKDAREHAATWSFDGKSQAMTRPLVLEKLRFDRAGRAALSADQFDGMTEKIEVLRRAGYNLIRDNLHLDAEKGIGGGLQFEKPSSGQVVLVRASGSRSKPAYRVACGADFAAAEVTEKGLEASAVSVFSRLEPAVKDVVDQVAIRYQAEDSVVIRAFHRDQVCPERVKIAKERQAVDKEELEQTERLKAEFGDDFSDPSGPILASEIREQLPKSEPEKTPEKPAPRKNPVEMER